MNKIFRFAVLNLGLACILTPVVLRAHCDTLQGPVVNSARAALKAGDVTPVLMWIKADDEKTIREAFNHTLIVRKQSKEAADLADTWFFETLVRVHRAGEGAPFTGLKSEAATEPGIAAADRALASGKLEDVLADTVLPLQAVLKAKFDRVRFLSRRGPLVRPFFDNTHESVAGSCVDSRPRLAILSRHGPAAPGETSGRIFLAPGREIEN